MVVDEGALDGPFKTRSLLASSLLAPNVHLFFARCRLLKTTFSTSGPRPPRREPQPTTTDFPCVRPTVPGRPLAFPPRLPACCSLTSPSRLLSACCSDRLMAPCTSPSLPSSLPSLAFPGSPCGQARGSSPCSRLASLHPRSLLASSRRVLLQLLTVGYVLASQALVLAQPAHPQVDVDDREADT